MDNNIYEYAMSVMKKKRAERNWSQQELADTVNISRSFIRDVENPHRRAKLNLFHINELAKVFQCSPKDFLPLEPL
jgi:transcriptional regulator with XRE-family HTH domain